MHRNKFMNIFRANSLPNTSKAYEPLQFTHKEMKCMPRRESTTDLLMKVLSLIH